MEAIQQELRRIARGLFEEKRIDLFIAELLKDPTGNQKQAAIRAGYSPKTAAVKARSSTPGSFQASSGSPASFSAVATSASVSGWPSM